MMTTNCDGAALWAPRRSHQQGNAHGYEILALIYFLISMDCKTAPPSPIGQLGDTQPKSVRW